MIDAPHIDNRFHDNLDLTSYVDMQSEKCWVRIYVKIHRQTRIHLSWPSQFQDQLHTIRRFPLSLLLSSAGGV